MELRDLEWAEIVGRGASPDASSITAPVELGGRRGAISKGQRSPRRDTGDVAIIRTFSSHETLALVAAHF